MGEMRSTTIPVLIAWGSAWLGVVLVTGCAKPEPTQPKKTPKQLPPAVKAAMERGDKALSNNDRKAAIAAYSEAIKLDGNLKRAYVNRGVAYNELGELQKALADFTKAIELDPTDSYPYEQRAQVYRKLGEVAKADADKEKAFQLREKRRDQIREDKKKWMESKSKSKKT